MPTTLVFLPRPCFLYKDICTCGFTLYCSKKGVFNLQTINIKRHQDTSVKNIVPTVNKTAMISSENLVLKRGTKLRTMIGEVVKMM